MATATPLQSWRASKYLYRNGRPEITVNDFLNTTETNNPSTAWWTDSHIENALRFLNNHYRPLGDVLIVDTSFSATLYRAATIPNFFPTETDSDYRDNYRPWKTRIEKHKIIFIPVNDGYSVSEAPTLGQAGSHWSFIVVDRQDAKKLRADYIDSLTDRKQKDYGTVFNGMVAGQILQGVELLLGLPRHAFNARTLRYVPNQNSDNKFENDVGACGPYMYAFMDHLLKHKSTLLDHGLKRYFNNPDRAVRQRSKKQLGFNSVVTRRKLAMEIFRERQRMEAEYPALSNHILNMQVLAHFIPRWTWEVFAAAFQLPHAKAPKDRRRDRPHGGTGGGGGGGDDGSNPSPGAPPPSVPITSGAEGVQTVQTVAQTTSAGSNIDQKQPPAPTIRPMLHNPDEPNVPDFGDTGAVDSASLKSWKKRNIVAFKVFRFDKLSDPLEQRALLQVLSGVDFARETDWRLLNIWKPLALDAGDDPDSILPGVIAQRLRNKFHVVTAAAAEPLPHGDGGSVQPPVTAQVTPTADPKKRKRPSGEEGEGQSDPKKQKKSDLVAPDFSALNDEALLRWLEMLPDNISAHFTKTLYGVTKIVQSYHCRRILQSVYSNVFEDLAKEKPLSAKSQGLIKRWKTRPLVLSAKPLNTEGDCQNYLQTKLIFNPTEGIKLSGGNTILQNCKLPDYTTDKSKWPEDEESEDEEQENHDDPMELDSPGGSEGEESHSEITNLSRKVSRPPQAQVPNMIPLVCTDCRQRNACGNNVSGGLELSSPTLECLSPSSPAFTPIHPPPSFLGLSEDDLMMWTAHLPRKQYDLLVENGEFRDKDVFRARIYMHAMFIGTWDDENEWDWVNEAPFPGDLEDKARMLQQYVGRLTREVCPDLKYWMLCWPLPWRKNWVYEALEDDGLNG